ncbi:MAG: hypothetical protein K940chlam3_00309 [Chlamydiae bacterium]|nr:hypothetical protein [Chlamydiota bacterium]
MTHFSDELEGDEIYFRDRWQFEQKYDFLPDPSVKTNDYTQEFYFYIPNALQINSDTYTTKQFYRDQTNLIRYKTPMFTLKELADPSFAPSPIAKIYSHKEITEENQELVQEEIKLLGNVFRSAIRKKGQELSQIIGLEKYDEFVNQANEFCDDVQNFLEFFEKIKTEMNHLWGSPSIEEHFSYLTFFVNHSLDQYMIQLLERVRTHSTKKLKSIDKRLSELLLRTQAEIPIEPSQTEEQGEKVVYTKGLLDKFFLNALLLKIDRFSPRQRYKNVIGAVAAGIAMLFFTVLWVWQGQFFIMNSEPFIIITVLLYILKDRIKEWIKSMTHHRHLGWFSDYTTKIWSPDDKHVLGVLKEKFSFIEEDEVPHEIDAIRNLEFHSVVESFKRPECILYYQKKMRIHRKPTELETRRFMLNIIFRFNIRHFMDKASNPYSPYRMLEEETQDLKMRELPKVYHLNIIVKTTIEKGNQPKKIEITKVRIVADKNGIKRVEYP